MDHLKKSLITRHSSIYYSSLKQRLYCFPSYFLFFFPCYNCLFITKPLTLSIVIWADIFDPWPWLNFFILYVFLESSRPAKNRRKRKGAASAAVGGGGGGPGGPMGNKKRSPGPNFSLASQVKITFFCLKLLKVVFSRIYTTTSWWNICFFSISRHSTAAAELVLSEPRG